LALRQSVTPGRLRQRHPLDRPLTAARAVLYLHAAGLCSSLALPQIVLAPGTPFGASASKRATALPLLHVRVCVLQVVVLFVYMTYYKRCVEKG
jgi:hypothetical protein